MISLERMREIGGKFASMSENELIEARTELYAFGNLAMRAWKEEVVPNIPIGLVAKCDGIDIINRHE